MAVNFMDMTIGIDNDKIVTTLFEKPMALYLYIPPHSAHPPGVTAGHIFGEILRIHRLCSAQDDILERTQKFFCRLRSRGHQPQQILPIFIKAIANAKKYIATSDEERQQIFNQKEEEARVERDSMWSTTPTVQKLLKFKSYLKISFFAPMMKHRSMN